MSILASLARAYERLPDAPPYGYSMEKIGFVISLNDDGGVAHVIDLRTGEGKKKQPRRMLVPQPTKRTVAISPNFLWDKTSYVLGITAKEGGRAADEHAAFVQRHTDAVENESDEGLEALLAFLKTWKPEQFKEPMWPEDMRDQNVVFALERERRMNVFLHDRPAVSRLWARHSSGRDRPSAVCLVSGEKAPVARLHPAIKGVWGAQSSGASIVSFNLDAFASYDHEQGDNAPVSERVAFAYTTTLNRFLESNSRHRIQIGDASTVFWADASDFAAAIEAESLFAAFIDKDKDDSDEIESAKIGDKLAKIRQGLPLKEVEPRLAGC